MSDDLGARLVQAGLITRDQLSSVLGTAPPHEGALVAELVRQGVDEDALAGYFVATGFGPLMEAVNLAGADIDVLRSVPPRMAVELLALPVRSSPAGLIVAMVAPSDRHALAELVRATAGGVLPTVARLVDLTIALRRAYPDGDAIESRDSEPPPLELVQRRKKRPGEEGYQSSTRGVDRVEARALVGPRLVVEDEDEGVVPLVRHKPLVTPLPGKRKIITKSFERPARDPNKRPSVVVPPMPADADADPSPSPESVPPIALVPKAARDALKPSSSAKAEALPRPPTKPPETDSPLKPSAIAKAEAKHALAPMPRETPKPMTREPADAGPPFVEPESAKEQPKPLVRAALPKAEAPKAEAPKAEPTKPIAKVEPQRPQQDAAKPIAKVEPPKPTAPAKVEPAKPAAPIAKAEPAKPSAPIAKAEPPKPAAPKVEPPKPAAPIAKAEPPKPAATEGAKPIAKVELVKAKVEPQKPMTKPAFGPAAKSAPPKLAAPARDRLPSIKTLTGSPSPAPAPQPDAPNEGRWGKGDRASQPPPKPASLIPPEHASWDQAGPDTKVDPVKLEKLSAPPKRVLRPPPIGGTLAAIRASRSRDEVVELACRGALTVCRAALLLALKKGVLKGQDGAGGNLTRDVVRNLWIPTKSPSMFRDVVGKREPYAGAHGTTAADGLFRAAVGSRGADVVLQPVAVGGKVVAVLAADDVGFDREGTERIEVLARAVGEAFERIIVAGKQS